MSNVNALHAAVAKNNYELCKLLIENGADVNISQMQNVTPLHSAAHRGNLSIVQLLVNHGATIEAKMDNGDNAMIIATRDKHQEVINYLFSLQEE
jgi:ankyrin repeat protein